MPDEDFFEEDLSLEEEIEQEKKASKKPARKKKRGAPRRPPEEPQALGLTWVVVLVVVAFFLGFVVRGFFSAGAATTTGIEGTQLQGQAPPLTQEQIQQGLPPGHPTIGETAQAGGGATAPATPKKK